MMKKTFVSILLLSGTIVLFDSCEKNKDEAPQLPPAETMAVNFNLSTAKTATDISTDTTSWNFLAAGITVFSWNVALTATLVVPVAAFHQAIQQEPVYLGNKKWQWEFTVTGFAVSYIARLTGTVREEDVKWEMYITKEGVLGHPEFLWFEGTSDLDGQSGQWILSESYIVQEAVLQIDWTKTSDVVGSVVYTYVRESSNGDPAQLTAGSKLSYGLVTGDLNAFYNIDYNNRNRADSANYQVNIEWSTTAYYGRIKAEHYFKDADWHCWDAQGKDAVCQ